MCTYNVICLCKSDYRVVRRITLVPTNHILFVEKIILFQEGLLFAATDFHAVLELHNPEPSKIISRCLGVNEYNSRCSNDTTTLVAFC